MKNCGAHTEQHDRRCPLYVGATLADFFDIIAVTSSRDVPLKQCIVPVSFRDRGIADGVAESRTESRNLLFETEFPV